MRKEDAKTAIAELYRITRPGGTILFTVDSLDEEYETQPHIINSDGDFLFTSGKWEGMVFHPYSEQELLHMLPPDTFCQIEHHENEITIKIQKPA